MNEAKNKSKENSKQRKTIIFLKKEGHK